ncbi:DUF998 domain-containing protein [Nonomuraea spiralis]|uniref:DUF998 domain-containing protein n=1 Tax=Nonomuraea spiralis TaxID=46182 RepID=A0ABV5IC41_9ACTN|nr:DUF998 domain-containing protein [Nonomuraea spiralis]GGS78931.1 hypothetical protein GCM10010176_022660 [Nonomuraea spiralis]
MTAVPNSRVRAARAPRIAGPRALMTTARLYPLVACASIVFSVVAILVGHFGPDPYLDPMNVTISEYAVTDRGGVTEVAMAVLGIGSLALLAALRKMRAPIRGLPEKLLMVWSAALVVVAVIPTVPLGLDLDLAAQIHRYVSIAAFVSLPAAGALLVPRLTADALWKPVARAVEWVALAGGFGVLAITYVALPGERVMIGLVERLLLGAEVSLLGLLAAWALWLTWAPGRSRNHPADADFTTYHRFIASRS